MEDFTGRNSERELGRAWLESVHDDDREELERHWGEAVGLRRSFDFHYRLRRADGEYGWIHHAAVPVTDSVGRLAGYLATCNDITEQRAAELNARAREHEIRTLADNVPVPIAYYVAKALKCMFANKAYANMSGLDEVSILGRTAEQVIREEGYCVIGPHIERVIRGESVRYERAVQARRHLNTSSR